MILNTRILAIIIGFLLFSFNGQSQDYFIEDLNYPTLGSSSVTVLPDGGWMVYEPQNSSVFRFNSCGSIEWAKQIQAQNEACCIGNAMVPLLNGNVAILHRETIGSSFGFRIIVLDGVGSVVWSKLYSRAGVDYYPYSIDVDIAGNIMVFVAEIPNGGGQGYRLVLKVNETGGVIWSKNYQTNSFWGASISTSNGASICRTGNTIFKINPNGSVDWGVRFQIPNTYDYFAPVEVSDGFIIPSKVTGTDEIAFVKLDKSGVLQWNEARNILNIASSSTNLFGLSNGNFVSVLNPTNGANPTLVEFDSDLQPQKTVRLGLTSTNLKISDLAIQNTGDILISGIQQGIVPTLMHGKLNRNYGSGCSMNVSVTTGTLAVSSSVVNIPVQDVVVDEVSNVITVLDLFYSTTNICRQNVSKPINLGVDTVICSNDSLILNSGSVVDYEEYLWSTGDVTPSITVKDSGVYYLTVKPYCENTYYSDTIVIGLTESPNPLNWQNIVDLCDSDPAVLDASVSLGSYLWEDGTTQPQREVSEGGFYSVTISSGSCTENFDATVSPCEYLMIPNVFTPNNDGVNDVFNISYEGQLEFSVVIYNRWGVQQFESAAPGFNWDGTTSAGVKVPSGVYYYIVTVGTEKHKGTLTLIK